MSTITTHILDTSKGKPATGIQVTLYQQQNKAWKEISSGISNNDGRVMDLLKKEIQLDSGVYMLSFSTKEYFEQQKIKSFYPAVEIIFDITSKEHYHVPLLISPFGYSTYRGS